VGQLTAVGVNVFVEYGAGMGVGFFDAEYLDNGAVMQKAEAIYKDKDMIIKFKGPSLASISQMKKGCTLFCMTHFHSFPDRAKMLEGLRRIQCLHVTGQAGARYGIKLLKENKPDLDIATAKVVVLGYGNVARGAMHEIYDQGFKNIHVLGAYTNYQRED